MAQPSTRILDHIVHLTPPGSLAETSAQFRSLGFTVAPGGTHADGLTANALVVLPSGVYLELLTFTHPVSHYPPGSSAHKARTAHPWANKQPGWIDFAFLGNSGTPSIAETINQRASEDGNGVHYDKEVRGGRKREDGEVLEWLISASDESHRGVLPFFCGDLTPRKLRVPLDPPSNVDHANDASGIAHVRLLVADDGFASLSKQLNTVLGAQPISSGPTDAIWSLDDVILAPNAATGTGEGHSQLILSLAQSDEERAYVRERGASIYEVGFVRYAHESGYLMATYMKRSGRSPTATADVH
ncbi:hypothetical protein CERSUDRAFT_107536 [Gelatoporia subvermispora B]|uniref:Glyoxalase-like domain-containing protein n=1 Tax=Ceriporiopsis subvermispora (strain B) TaxID=914234 RepID=M2QQ81_CERS8|nr:hypothetical protein CERSUDRAFT_107536 [Gelatoporia subvermispora B]